MVLGPPTGGHYLQHRFVWLLSSDLLYELLPFFFTPNQVFVEHNMANATSFKSNCPKSINRVHLLCILDNNNLTETGSKSSFDPAYFHQKLSTEVILLSNSYTKLLWIDAIDRKGSHRRKYFLKTVQDSIGCTLSYMCERSRQKNIENPSRLLKVEMNFDDF